MGRAGGKPGCDMYYRWHCYPTRWSRSCKGILEQLEADLAGNFFDKTCVGASWSDETSHSYMWCLPKLKLGMVSSISRGEKNVDPGEAMALCKCVQAEGVGFSSLRQSEAQGMAATDTRGVGPPRPSTLARPPTRCQDPPRTA